MVSVLERSRGIFRSWVSPSRRNAVVVGVFLLGAYGYLILTELVFNANIDRLRMNKGDPNELFDVTPNHNPPALTFVALSVSPFVLACYVSFFLRGEKTPLLPTASRSPGSGWVGLMSTRMRVGLIASSALVSFCAGLHVLSAYALICNYPLAEMADLCTFSHQIMDVIKAKHGQDAIWLTQGTLIGALRGDDTKNRMILNDHDFDTCYDKNLEPKILETVKSMGVMYERFSLTYSKLDTHIRIYPPSFSLLSGHSGPLIFELQACDPATTQKVIGCNNLPVSIPTNFEEVLTAEYGSDWRTPKSYNHAVICRIFSGW